MKQRSYDFYGFAGAFIVLSSVIALWAGSQVRNGQSVGGAANAEAHGQSTSAQPDVSSQTASSQPQVMGQTNLQQPGALAEPNAAMGGGAPRGMAPEGATSGVKSPVKASSAPLVGARTIAWESNYETAVIRARAEGKPLMVDFYTDWCVACKQLDAQVYSKSNIIASTQNFVCVKVNAERRTDLAGAYGVKGFPTITFMRMDATSNLPLGTLPGAVDAKTFAQVLDTAQEQYRQAGSMSNSA